MKTKFFCILMMLLIAPLSFAQLPSYWKYFGKSSSGSYYGNTRDQMTVDGFEAAWFLNNNEKGGSELSLEYANCKTGHLGISKIIYYSNRDLGGYVVKSIDAPVRDFDLVIPGSVAEGKYDFICNKLY